MKVHVIESGKIEELRLVDPESGVEWTQDFVGTNGGIGSDLVPAADAEIEAPDDAEYVAHAAAFAFWKAAALREQRNEDDLAEIRSVKGRAWMQPYIDRFMFAENGLEDEQRAARKAIQAMRNAMKEDIA